jgi:hypothetical protein
LTGPEKSSGWLSIRDPAVRHPGTDSLRAARDPDE